MATAPISAATGASWKASVPMAARATWPQITTIGTESAMQSRIGVTVLVAPGPEVTRHTPDPARGAREAGRHEARALLVRRHDQRHLRAAALRLLLVVEEHRIVRRQNGPAAVAEDGLDALVGQHLHDHPRPGHGLAGERMPEGTGLDDGVAHAEISESARDVRLAVLGD